MGNRLGVAAASAGDRLLDVGIALVLVGGLVLPIATAGAATGDPVLLNEMLVSHTGDDTTEYVELYGTPGHSLDGLSLVVVDGDNGSAGQVDLRVDFGPGDRLGGNGFFLVGNPVGLAANYGVAPDVALAGNDLLENGSQTVALVQTASLGAGGTVGGSETVLDSVGLQDTGFTETFFWGAPVFGPIDGFFPAGARRATDGADTDSPDDWVVADDLLGADNTPTPASAVDESPTAACDPTLTTTQGTAAEAAVTASDPDGTVTAFSLAVTPDPGHISLAAVSPAPGVGEEASASVVVAATTPVGVYQVVVTALTDAMPPQEATCNVAVTVEEAPGPPPPDPPGDVSFDELNVLLDELVADGSVDDRRADALRGHLERAQRFAAAGQDAAAQAQLQALTNQVDGFSPRWVTSEGTGALGEAAGALAAQLGG
ncbi:MAG TPA: hypothetical protein VF071_02005 [Candidatus Limnocylindria bacterium]